MIKEMIGKRVCELRITRTHLSQGDFANKIKINRSFLSRIERGKANMTLGTLLIICKGLNISLSDFFHPLN